MPLRAYFVVLFAVALVAALAGAFFVDQALEQDARVEATRDALHAAENAAQDLSTHVATVRSASAQLAANPQIAAVLAQGAKGCTLSFSGIGGPDRSHLDILRADGTVACSSRPLTSEARRTGYARSSWLSRAFREQLFLDPVRDPVGGTSVVISSMPMPGGKGAVVAFLDLVAVGKYFDRRYAGGRETLFLLRSSDRRTVIARSLHADRWIGTRVEANRFTGPNGSEEEDLEGKTRLYVHVPIAGVGWNLIVGEKESSVLATVTRLRTRQLLQIGVGLALLLLLGAFVYWKLVTPIRRLSRSVREASGRADHEPFPVSGPSEVRTLAEDVNTLTAAVHRELDERRRSEARYHDLFENASDLITTLDLEGRLTAVNAAFVKATGYSRRELIGKPLAELVPTDQRDSLTNARNGQLDDPEMTMYESELLSRDGRLIQIEVSSRLVFEQGHLVGSEAICRDITERLQLEGQLRQAQRLEAVGTLAGGVAHDFNNLLTVISGYTETIRERGDRGSEFELSQVAAAAERAAVLTRQLLAFSRRQVLQPRVLQLNDIVEGIAPMLSRLIGEDVELSTSLEPELGHVLADPTQLEQIVVNLAVNARDAMPTGGRLTIQTTNVELNDEHVAHHGECSAGPHVLLAVSDTGEGMDAATLEHMFEPFFTTKPVGTGTGLGLATVYGIVKQSGGNVSAYSEPSRGTTFKIYLPVTDALMTPAVSRPVAVSATGTETILLAEDHESLRRLTEDFLEERGYAVIAARSADEAVAIAAENSRRIDLLLTDVVMPNLSGPEVAQRVSELVPGIKILYMSGYADDIVLRSGTLSAGDAFLAKPFNTQDLAAKVRETLDAEPAVRSERSGR